MTEKLEISGSYWSRSQEDLLNGLQSSPAGLTNREAEQRLDQFGLNTLQTKARTTPFGLFLNQFKSPIILILLVATGISAVVGDWTDAFIILVIILGSALLSFTQEFNANNAAEKLRSQITIKTTALRDGQEVMVLSEEIVPGDIVLLSAGSLIPADAVVLDAKDFFVNQAVLTGETFPVEKKSGPTADKAALGERTNTVFMGTNVHSGEARVLIVQTGSRTIFGQIARRLTITPPETEFERGIRRLGYLLSEIMFVLVLAIFAINVFFHKPVLDSLLFSIAVAVGLTPQLLPAIININLSKGSQLMAVKGVIVRRLASIENFGSMDILCTDKTGTLTEGVVHLDKALDVQGQLSDRVFREAYLNAYFQSGLTNPLDKAITAENQPDLAGVEKVDEIPYDFVRKRMSVVVQEQAATRLVTKGALESILAICSQVEQDGTALPLDENRTAGIHGCYEEWSRQGFRVLGVAKKAVSSRPSYSAQEETGLTFMGFLLFFDPPKAGVQETILELERLGVQLKIITGDNKPVALHVAQSVGLQSPRILTGEEIDRLRDEALWQVAEHTTIFAEVDPNQKERIILALKKTGHVVGYMGDGINDAPSLHSADVSISVENAVDVAKDAADFVLLKQDLSVLQQGILQGRRTFANTLKYVFMATSANFGNMFSVAGASLFLPFLPMLPKQILLINFLTDLPEMTIAGDRVDDVFIQGPRRWDVRFIRNFMLIFGPLSSVFDFLTFGLLLWVLHANQAHFHTGWFIESVLSATTVVFVLRTQMPFMKSKPSRSMLMMTIAVACVALLIPYSPLANLLGFKPLPPLLLVAIAAVVIIYVLSAEATKHWFYKHVHA